MVIEYGALEKVQNRLTRHFDNFYVDEVQDFAANDFNLLLELSRADVAALYAGDYYQHTYDTRRDGNTRSTLYAKGAAAYTGEFKKAGFDVDTMSLARSRRCSPAVCAYITDTLGINIGSLREDDTKIIFVSNPDEISKIYQNPNVVKLFYQNQAKYDCYSNNWGNSKGLDNYQDVCIVLNKTTYELLKADRGRELKPATKNKLYVACSRTRGKLYFVEEKLLKSVI